ncbi:MAG: GGDEF domain-containing protein [Deltaproteobacteria bacterium]|nr:GGDEF domain-containing protein [Deltaproteobacteria bacterium]
MENPATRRFGPLHIAFLSGVGLSGWAALLLETLSPNSALRPWELSWELLATALLCVAARFLAFRIFRRVRIALDSAFYVAAAFAFGVVPAAWMVAVVLTADHVVRIFVAERAHQGTPWRYVVAQAVYVGGLPALGIFAVGIIYDVDGSMFLHSDWGVAWRLAAFGITFLVIHYTVAGGSHWFEGAPTRALWREFLLKVVLAESTLLPFALAMVFGELHQGIVQFLLLGALGLLFNWIFRRGYLAREALDFRVQELSTLNAVAQIISSSLEHEVLLKNISTETLRLVGHRSRFMLGLVDESAKTAHYELFDEQGKRYKEMDASSDEGLSGWVMAHREPLMLTGEPGEYLKFAKTDRYDDPGFPSWMGVPLVTYGEVMGVMSVQSEAAAAYTAEHLRVLSAIADQAAVAIENSRLYELATIDGLTGLLVRRHFDQRLHEEWWRSVRYDNSFAVSIFDLDDFKGLNDTFGHQAGDQVLRAVARVVKKNVRGADLAGRYGGEEFALLLPRAKIAEACKMVDRIRADIEAIVMVVDGRRLKITASFGVAGYPETGVTKVEDLVARADQALYQAKDQGKNRVVAAPNVHAGAVEPARSADG